MTEKDRQHILPQFYLRGFSNDGKLIYAFDREDGEIRRQPIRKTACQTDYYTAIGIDGKKNKEIEDYFSFIEGKAAEPIKKLDAGIDISDTEKSFLSFFLGYFFVRGDYYKNVFNEGGKKFGKIFLEEITSSTSNIKEMIDSYENSTGDKTNLTSEKFLETLNNCSIKFHLPKEFRLDAMLNAGLEIGVLIYNMAWLVQYCHKESSFITSDNPLTIYGSFGSEEPMGIASPGKIKIVSLTKKTCLVLGDIGNASNKPLFIEELTSKEDTRDINHNIA